MFLYVRAGLLVPAVVEIVYRYEEGYGFAKWVLIKNLLLGAFAILALVTGTFTSILEIIDLYKEK